MLFRSANRSRVAPADVSQAQAGKETPCGLVGLKRMTERDARQHTLAAVGNNFSRSASGGADRAGVCVPPRTNIKNPPTAPATTLKVEGRMKNEELVRALYGETCGESYACKVATARAMLNRGTLRGVYGKDSKLLRQPINAKAWADCVRALAEAQRGADVTRGAQFWACKQDLGKPYLRGLVCTAQVGGHWFFAKASGPQMNADSRRLT